jgi:hypothetical protein
MALYSPDTTDVDLHLWFDSNVETGGVLTDRSSYRNDAESRYAYWVLPDVMEDNVAGGTAFAVVHVPHPPTDPYFTGPVFGDWGSSAEANHQPWVDGVTYDDFGSTCRYTVGPVDYSTPRLVAFTSSPVGWSCRVDGKVVFEATVNTVGWNSSPTLGLSTFGVSSDRHDGYVFPGTWAEVVVYGRPLDPPTLSKVEGYLAHKYGLATSLPTDHPFRQFPPKSHPKRRRPSGGG